MPPAKRRVVTFAVAATMGLILAEQLPAAAKRIPAFPGAEGLGAHTPGGRGGRIIEVTNHH